MQRLNADVRYNNNALKEYNDCIGGLLHLGLWLLHVGLNVITFRTKYYYIYDFITRRTVITFRPSTYPLILTGYFGYLEYRMRKTPTNSHINFPILGY